jgi:hypothetical protein
MPEKTNNKQKNKKIVLFWNLRFGICDLFEIWCLEFVILVTKFQGRAIYL